MLNLNTMPVNHFDIPAMHIDMDRFFDMDIFNTILYEAKTNICINL